MEYSILPAGPDYWMEVRRPARRQAGETGKRSRKLLLVILAGFLAVIIAELLGIFLTG